MTDRSDRRKAELAVLVAATQLVQGQWKTYLGYGQERALIEAAQNLRALGPAQPAKPRSSGAGNVTSEMAAAYMNGKRAGTQRAWILRRLQYGTGWTTDQLVEASQRPHQSISARVNELRDAGWLADSGETRKTRSGMDAIVWVLTDAARHAIQTTQWQAIPK